MWLRQKILWCMIGSGICYGLIALHLHFNTQNEIPAKPAYSSLKELVKSHKNGEDVRATDASETGPVIIVAYMRSGSTMTGNILQMHPDTFYIYEPLHHLIRNYQAEVDSKFARYKIRSVRPLMLVKEESQALFRAWFTCDFDFILEKPHRHFLAFFKLGFKTNKVADCLNETLDKGDKQSTRCTTLLKNTCLESKHKVIKTIRTPLHWIYELMDEFPTMKVINLVRDPRAIITSQRKFGQCQEEKFDGIVGCCRLLCSNMEDDLTTFNVLNKMYPGRIMRLKYEDLATDPIDTTLAVYKYLQFEFTDSVKSYVKHITQSGAMPKHSLDSVRPDSKSPVDAWRSVIPQSLLDTIQYMCVYSMEKLSYHHFIRPYNFTVHNPSRNISIIRVTHNKQPKHSILNLKTRRSFRIK